MNSRIFAKNPSGRSMEEVFTASGFEVWSVDMRGQGQSYREPESVDYGLNDLALTDLATALRMVRKKSFGHGGKVHAVGCSLGGTLLFLHLAHYPTAPIASVVTIASPLRWVDVHPLLRRLFVSPRLAGFIPVRGTRRAVRAILPVLLRFPRLLSLYMNAAMVDTSDVSELVQSVEDPSRRLNEEIARWIRDGELQVYGRPLSTLVARLEQPYLGIAGNADGIVPPASALSAYEALSQTSSSNRARVHTKSMIVGTADLRFAHADLFISRYSESKVYAPIAAWIMAREASVTPKAIAS